MRPLFLVGHVLSCRERYVQNYVFAFCACGWGLVLSTKLLAGKVCFYVFMFFENEPVDTLLKYLRLNTNIFWVVVRSQVVHRVVCTTFFLLGFF
jgi:hypothetical protein